VAGERVEPQCVLPADPEVVKQDGNAVLLRWEMPADDFWFARGVPDDAKYLAYRRAIREAGADLERPIADEPVAKTDEEREMWKRERENAELTFGSGHVRRVECLDAALFAHQHARYDELVQPTEFVATVLRRQAMIRVYFSTTTRSRSAPASTHSGRRRPAPRMSGSCAASPRISGSRRSG